MAISAQQVMELRASTGAGMMDCKKALEDSNGDLDAAKDYLRTKGISIAQKKSGRETTEGGISIAIADDGKQGAMVQLASETDFVARNEQFQQLLQRLSAQALAKGGENLGAQSLNDGSGTVDELITESIGTLGENLNIADSVSLSVSGEGLVAGYVHSNQKIGVLVALSSDKPVSGAELGPLARDVAMHVAASQVSAIDASSLDPAILDKEREILTAQAKESGKPEEIISKMVDGRMSKFVKEITLLDQPFVKDPETTVGQRVADAGKGLGATLAVERFIKFQF